MKTMSPEEQYKLDNYFTKINQHMKCEGRPLYGAELWTHVKSCEKRIPQPKIDKTVTV